MSFLKKLIILLYCTAMVQPTFAMYKKQVGNAFKAYAKKGVNGIKQVTPLNKMPKLSFGTTYFKHMNWKKMAAAGALATGYGLWKWNDAIAAAQAPMQEKSWNELSKKEKDAFVQKYSEDLENTVSPATFFEKASEFEKDAILYVIAQKLEQGSIINEFSILYTYCTSSQKDTLLPSIVHCLTHGYSIANLDKVYEGSNEQQQSILLSAVLQSIKQGHGFSSIYWAYKYANELEKDKLCDVIFDLIKAKKNGPKLDSEIFYLYENSNESQKNKFIPFIVERLKKGCPIHCLALIYRTSNEEQKDHLIPAIIEYDKTAVHNSSNMYDIYMYSNTPQKSRLLTNIINKIENDDLFDSYTCAIYSASNQQQKEILFPIVLKKITPKSCFYIKHINLIYQCANQEQKNILFPLIFEKLKQDDGTELDTIYNYFDERHKAVVKDFFLGSDINFDVKTQSTSHIGENIGSVYSNYFKKIKTNSKLLVLFKNVINSESTFSVQDYYVFYHAQRRDVWLKEVVYTILAEIKHATSFNEYLFTRFPKDGLCSENAQLIQQQRMIRKKLFEHGCLGPHRSSLVFLNYGILANSTNRGSSSFEYFLDNHNVTNPEITLRNVFEKFELQALYDKNKELFDKLEEQFLALSPHGNILQIAIPKEHLKKHVYLTTSGGPKIKAQIKKDVFNYTYNKKGEIVDVIENRIIETDDVIELIKTLKSNPQAIVDSDQKEFVWIVTADTVHKAVQDGVKIKSFNTADPEKLKEVTDKITNLLTKELAGHWAQPEKNPWKCYKEYKKNL